MSYTEEQIRYFVRDELRKILDKGLMYSAEAKPQAQAKTELPIISSEILEYCDVSGNPVNKVKPKVFIHNREIWERINAELKEQGFKWVSDGKNSRWEK